MVQCSKIFNDLLFRLTVVKQELMAVLLLLGCAPRTMIGLTAPVRVATLEMATLV